jgi:hypothetical protein
VYTHAAVYYSALFATCSVPTLPIATTHYEVCCCHICALCSLLLRSRKKTSKRQHRKRQTRRKGPRLPNPLWHSWLGRCADPPRVTADLDTTLDQSTIQYHDDAKLGVARVLLRNLSTTRL